MLLVPAHSNADEHYMRLTRGNKQTISILPMQADMCGSDTMFDMFNSD